MPLQSSHVFCSHIGHTGKTTLCFQLSCLYAKLNPDVSVLVMDFTEEGDLTKRFMGGVDSSATKVDELFGKVFRLISDADSKSKGLTSWLFKSEVDITSHVIRVVDHNEGVPPNVFLVSSGAWPEEDKPMETAVRKRLAAKISESLQGSEKTWKLFCDTDGDRRPSPYTMMAYSLCPHAIVPLHLSKADLDRTSTMLHMLHDMRVAGEVTTQVSLIVWNLVKVLKDEPCQYRGALGELGLELPFTPTKVSLDILDACNERLFNVSKDLPGLFKLCEDGCELPVFVRNSTAVVRQLADNVLKPSEEVGLPFVQMAEQLAASGKKSTKFKTGGVEYDAKDAVITGADDAMQGLWRQVASLSLD